MNLPVFFENSWVPGVLSKVSPINISAITLGPFIFCRDEASETLRRHEKIHWEQYKECFILGFLILYLYYWLRGISYGFSGQQAYYLIPFEREAYDNQDCVEYLSNRKRFAWRDHR